MSCGERVVCKAKGGCVNGWDSGKAQEAMNPLMTDGMSGSALTGIYMYICYPRMQGTNS